MSSTKAAPNRGRRQAGMEGRRFRRLGADQRINVPLRTPGGTVRPTEGGGQQNVAPA